MSLNIITALQQAAQVVKPYDPTTITENIEEPPQAFYLTPYVSAIGITVIIATIVLFFVIRKQMRG